MTECESSKANVVGIDELVRTMTRELNYYWSLGEFHDERSFCPIYKIQHHIREVDRNAYEPIILSIGPYHHGASRLLAMEKEKWNCLDYILKLNPKKCLKDYLQAIRRLEKQARNCYSEEIEMDTKKFLEMLLLDGCFILVSLYGMDGFVLPMPELHGKSSYSQEISEENVIALKVCSREHGKCVVLNSENHTAVCGHAMKNSALEVELGQIDLSQRSYKNDEGRLEVCGQDPENSDQYGQWYISFLMHDVLLLENQIPFFIVKRIYELVAGQDTSTPLTDKIAAVVEDIIRCYPKAITESERPKDFHHLLHLGHIYFRPSQKLEEDQQYRARPQYFNRFLNAGCKFFKLSHQAEESDENLLLQQKLNFLQVGNPRWRRAVQYYEAGVEFQKKKSTGENCYSLLDIKFSNGVMEIPPLPIDENTSSLFRNLIALEQTCPQFGNDFTAYVIFISQIISMSDDVTLLAQRGIIVHQLRSDKEVSTLFTKLSKDVVFDFNGQYYLKYMSLMLEEHYQSRLNRWMAWLRHNHFSNPWLALAALGAAIMLFCTVVQTLISVFSYVKPTAYDSDTSN